MMAALFILIGVICLYFGAEYLVYGSASFALRMGMPSLLIGLLVVGYGTGVPELVVSVEASLLGKGDIAVGNVVGSNLANIGLILGISALLRPVEVHKRVIEYDGIVLVVVSLLASIVLGIGNMTRLYGALFLFGLLIYSVWVVRAARDKNHQKSFIVEHEVGRMTKSIAVDFIMVAGGIALLVLGGNLFLKGAIIFAKTYGISDAVIAITVVAIGTSLPELATSIVAVLRNEGDIALGNIIGSCIFNLLGIVGVSSLIAPFQLVEISAVDLGAMLFFAVVLFGMMYSHQRVSRMEGGILLGSYLGYLAYLTLS